MNEYTDRHLPTRFVADSSCTSRPAKLSRSHTAKRVHMVDPQFHNETHMAKHKPALSAPSSNSRSIEDRLAFRGRLLEVVRQVGSEAELERRAGLPAATITHYTRSRPSEPSRAYLVKIALAAGVSIAWLAAGLGPKKVSE